MTETEVNVIKISQVLEVALSLLWDGTGNMLYPRNDDEHLSTWDCMEAASEIVGGEILGPVIFRDIQDWIKHDFNFTIFTEAEFAFVAARQEKQGCRFMWLTLLKLIAEDGGF